MEKATSKPAEHPGWQGRPTEVSAKGTTRTPVRMLLVHEILHSLWDAGCPLVFDSLMLGNLSDDGRTAFWEHLHSCEPWKRHPVLNRDDVSFSRLVGFTLHADGAQMYTDDEFFVYSVSSVFSGEGMSKDILLVKIPLAIIPERQMKSKKDS